MQAKQSMNSPQHAHSTSAGAHVCTMQLSTKHILTNAGFANNQNLNKDRRPHACSSKVSTRVCARTCLNQSQNPGVQRSKKPLGYDFA